VCVPFFSCCSFVCVKYNQSKEINFFIKLDISLNGQMYTLNKKKSNYKLRRRKKISITGPSKLLIYNCFLNNT
jgi:hypothetical protein